MTKAKSEIVECEICYKDFKRLVKTGSRVVGHRTKNCKTCSPKCSRIYTVNIRKIQQRKRHGKI